MTMIWMMASADRSKVMSEGQGYIFLLKKHTKEIVSGFLIVGFLIEPV